METKVKELIAEAMNKIQGLANANAMLCDPVTVGEVTIVPVAKVSVGFAGGGSDLPAKVEKECFGGGTGGGITLAPIGFLIVTGKDVRFIQVNPDNSSSAGIVNMIPELFEKVKDMVENKGKDKSSDKSDEKTPNQSEEETSSED